MSLWTGYPGIVELHSVFYRLGDASAEYNSAIPGAKGFPEIALLHPSVREHPGIESCPAHRPSSHSCWRCR